MGSRWWLYGAFGRDGDFDRSCNGSPGRIYSQILVDTVKDVATKTATEVSKLSMKLELERLRRRGGNGGRYKGDN